MDFDYSLPPHDNRPESCRVHEESIKVDGNLKPSERASVLDRIVQPSIDAAAEQGMSLAVIRPKDIKFTYNKKSSAQIAEEKTRFEEAARQTSFLDEELAALEPSPYDFRFKFADNKNHNFACLDWETHAMFYAGLRRGMSKSEALEWMDHTFNVVYPERGMMFAVGNQAKRRHTWQLLGVLRVDETDQGSLLV